MHTHTSKHTLTKTYVHFSLVSSLSFFSFVFSLSIVLSLSFSLPHSYARVFACAFSPFCRINAKKWYAQVLHMSQPLHFWYAAALICQKLSAKQRNEEEDFYNRFVISRCCEMRSILRRTALEDYSTDFVSVCGCYKGRCFYNCNV